MLCGGEPTGDFGGAAITAVGADDATLLPRTPAAATLNRIVFPVSAEVSVYDRPAAPGMATQLLPLGSQRSHE